MYLKINEINNGKLILDLTNGMYTIVIEVTALKIEKWDYTSIHTEVIEEYDSMDYKIEEMLERFYKVYELLSEEESKWKLY